MLADKLRAASLSAKALPTFVSSSVSGASSSTSITVTAPSGIQDGDLLVAICTTGSGGSGEFTVPSGFSLTNNDTTAGQKVSLAVKIASSESGNYTFGQPVASVWSAAILVYRNATKINTVGSVQKGSSVSIISASSITPTLRGVLMSVFCASANTSVSTAPSGTTQRVLGVYGVGAGSTLASYELSPQEASASAAQQITWAASTSNCLALQFQITNESTVAPEFVASESTQNWAASATLTINKPAGTVEGDLMVAVMAANGATTDTWSGDTGWTEVADYGGGKPALRVAYKLAGASEPSTYTFTDSASSHLLSGCILTYRYAAYDTVGTFVSGTDPLSLSSISPSESQSILIAAGARDGASITLGTPTSMTARVTDNDATGPSYIVCDQKVAKGPTGTRSMSTGGQTDAGILLSIKPTRALT